MRYGEVSVSKSTNYCEQIGSNKVSPYMKEKLIYIGQMTCYEEAADVANRLMGITTNDTMIYRLTDQMGEDLKDEVDNGEFHEIETVEDDDYVYSQVDGMMLLTREFSWKETKLGRVFKHSSILPESGDRQWIRRSEYVSHVGYHEEFEQKMSVLLDHYEGLSERLVFINDGAKWIQNWIDAEYPKATQILDFYHAMSHISDLVKVCIKDSNKRREHMSELGHILKTEGYEKMMDKLNELKITTKKQQTEKDKLLGYLGRNKHRMDYPLYRKKGMLIGSGPIESAHRTVLQERLKRSGQRWSINGLQNIIRLRVLNKSDHWDRVKEKLALAA